MNLSFSIYWLLVRPDLKEKLMTEIERVLPVTAEALAKMKFLNNFMREVLCQGADKIVNGKKAMYDFTFSNGYQVPKGRMIESSLRQLNFGDNSTRTTIDEMDPDMSLNKISTTPGSDFASFGMDKHLCPGKTIKLSSLYNLN
jgi:cytochrome P450